MTNYVYSTPFVGWGWDTPWNGSGGLEPLLGHEDAPIQFLTGWSQPPHPFDVIPSFDPSANLKDQARAVLRDYYHDDDLRSWADKDEVKKAFGVQKKEDYDTSRLVHAYENPKDSVWSKGANWSDLSAAVQKATARRTKLGPFPAPSNYVSDPVVIYYYDSDRMKRVEYPRASFTDPSGPMNPGNLYWWRGDGIHTFERHDDGSWGDEGFDWDKDAVGNVGDIAAGVMAAVGAVLQVIPGIGTAIGAALILTAPLVGAALKTADTAFQGGDMSKAVANIGTAVGEVASKGLGKAMGVKMDDAGLKHLGTSLGTLAADQAGLAAKGKNFADAWASLASQADKYAIMDDDAVDAIGKSLGSPAAATILRKGYDVAQYTDPQTIGAVSSLFADAGAAHLFQFGAGLGLLHKAQEDKKTGTAPVLSSSQGKTTMTTGYYYAGQVAPATSSALDSLFGSGSGDWATSHTTPAASSPSPGASSGSSESDSGAWGALASIVNKLADVGGNALDKAIGNQNQSGPGAPPAVHKQLSAQEMLAALVQSLGMKYGLTASPPGAAVHTGALMAPPVTTGATAIERYRLGKTATQAHLTNDAGAWYGVGWDSVGQWVGQCIDPHDHEIVPIADFADNGVPYCIDPHNGQKIDLQGNFITSGNVVGVQSTTWFDPRFMV